MKYIKYKKNNHNKICIIQNKKIKYEYKIEEKINAGLSLLGWEVKSLRLKKISIDNSYISIKNNEAYLFGAHIIPLYNTCNINENDHTRLRKILIKKREIRSLYHKIQLQGYTAVPLFLYWENSWVKLNIGIAKGYKMQDKRINIKNREWNIHKSRIAKYKIYKN